MREVVKITPVQYDYAREIRSASFDTLVTAALFLIVRLGTVKLFFGHGATIIEF
jgi:hypothetical protein